MGFMWALVRLSERIRCHEVSLCTKRGVVGDELLLSLCMAPEGCRKE